MLSSMIIIMAAPSSNISFQSDKYDWSDITEAVD